MKTLLSCLVLGILFFAAEAGAAGRELDILQQSSLIDMEIQSRRKALKSAGYRSPIEPSFPQVTYLKIEPPANLQQQIDELLHGIYIDIPPEFDHYGYELRRYMAHIAGPGVLPDPERLAAEVKNVRNAKIIFDHWRKDLQKKISDIEAALEADKGSSSLITTFKYNRGIVHAFIIECKSWIDNNQKMLEFLNARTEAGLYGYSDPIIIFVEPEDRQEFTAIYRAQQKSLAYINEYLPFRNMIY